jgi:hypothetical protein
MVSPDSTAKKELKPPSRFAVMVLEISPRVTVTLARTTNEALQTPGKRWYR